MNDHTINLGPRLQAIASFIRAGSLLGDIGTDHAYLPAYLVQQGIIRGAVGVDIHEGPYRSALETVRAYGLSDLIDVRLGNGLRPLQRGEVNVLVLAGMGGNTILQILFESEDVLQEVEELVLQPQGAEGKVRRELLNKGWKIKEELLVEEEGRIYAVVHFTRTEGLDYDALEDQAQEYLAEVKAYINSGQGKDGQDNEVKESFLDSLRKPQKLSDNSMANNFMARLINKTIWGFGPIIIKKEKELLKQLINNEVERLRKVAAEMQYTDRKEVAEKAKEICDEIKLLEVIKLCRFQ